MIDQIPFYTRGQIWKTSVRPVVEYGACVACPTNQNILQLERIQRYAAKQILKCNTHSASEAVISELRMEPLKTRYEIQAAAFAHRLASMPNTRLSKKVFKSVRNINHRSKWGQYMEELIERLPSSCKDIT